MVMARRLWLCAACLLLAPAAAEAPEGDECDTRTGLVSGCQSTPTVKTENGPVSGYVTKDGDTSETSVSSFLGIPFADPPVGQNRFRAPQPVKRNWTEPLKATKRSAICLQYPPWGIGRKASEDCLYLNVYTPTSAIGSQDKLPVMVWIYGGAYVFGDAYLEILGEAAYDGAALAGRHDVVIVTMNYRLNGFGFFASDALKEEDPDHSTGNMGARDQRAALQWVQRNIAGFGGDPSKVTLFGESAGGFSVVWHLVSPQSWPLFSKAIIESGTSAVSWFFQPYEGHAKEFYSQWSEKIGCPGSGKEQLDCMRKAPASSFIKPPKDITVASPGYDPKVKAIETVMAVGACVDQSPVGLSDVPIELMRAGHFNKVPLIVGANKDDGSIFELVITEQVPGLLPPTIRSKKGIDLGLEYSFGHEQVVQIEQAYPESEFKGGLFRTVDYQAMFSRMVRDVVFQCSDREIAEAWLSHGIPVFMYTFAFDLGWLDKLSHLGDLHGSEILFVWRHFLWLPEVLTHKGTRHMADIVSCKWTTFAHTGAPDGSGPSSWPRNCADIHPQYAAWPQYNHANRQYYSLQFPPVANQVRANNTWPDDEFPSDKRCDMVKQLKYPWPRRNADTASIVV